MSVKGGSAMATVRPRSPSHAAKNKTPEDRVWEFGCVLGEREGRLLCRPCNLHLDHTRRSTIVEHLRSRKHHRKLEESGLETPLAGPQASVLAASAALTPVILVDSTEENNVQQETATVRSTTSPPQAP
ncbi:unnamed protein product, partial [Meganyctiphanes norvegica]